MSTLPNLSIEQVMTLLGLVLALLGLVLAVAALVVGLWHIRHCQTPRASKARDYNFLRLSRVRQFHRS